MSDHSVSAPNLSELQTHRSEKWRGFASDVLPLPVAEMDFPVAQPIRDLLTEMVAKSDLGYLGAIPELGHLRRKSEHARQDDEDHLRHRTTPQP